MATTTQLQNEVKALLQSGSSLLLLEDNEGFKLIKEFIEIRDDDDSMIKSEKFGEFREKNKGVDNFFAQVEFNKYLLLRYQRAEKVRFNNEFGQNHTWQKVITYNKLCLDAVIALLKNAKEQFEIFQRVSNQFQAKQSESPKQRSLFARTFNLGRESNYVNMTTGKGIPSSLYLDMLHFAYTMSILETRLTTECARIFKGGYNQYTSNIFNIIDFYENTSAELLQKMEECTTFNNAYFSDIHEFIYQKVGEFIKTLEPPSSGGASGQRSRRRFRKSKSVRRKKRVTKHRFHRG